MGAGWLAACLPASRARPQTSDEETLVYGHFTGGFSIGGDEVRGSLLLFPRSFFGWTVTDFSALTIESLSLFWVRTRAIGEFDLICLLGGERARNDETWYVRCGTTRGGGRQ